jgi:hypothetical protein
VSSVASPALRGVTAVAIAVFVGHLAVVVLHDQVWLNKINPPQIPSPSTSLPPPHPFAPAGICFSMNPPLPSLSTSLFYQQLWSSYGPLQLCNFATGVDLTASPSPGILVRALPSIFGDGCYDKTFRLSVHATSSSSKVPSSTDTSRGLPFWVQASPMALPPPPPRAGGLSFFIARVVASGSGSSLLRAFFIIRSRPFLYLGLL